MARDHSALGFDLDFGVRWKPTRHQVEYAHIETSGAIDWRPCYVDNGYSLSSPVPLAIFDDENAAWRYAAEMNRCKLVAGVMYRVKAVTVAAR